MYKKIKEFVNKYIIVRRYYTKNPVYCLKKRRKEYLVRWEIFRYIHFGEKYLTARELLSKGILAH